jgi:hypothetical protein
VITITPGPNGQCRMDVGSSAPLEPLQMAALFVDAAQSMFRRLGPPPSQAPSAQQQVEELAKLNQTLTKGGLLLPPGAG